MRKIKSFLDLNAWRHVPLDWGKIDVCADVETAWSYFYLGFMKMIDRHAPLRKFRVKGRDNPWFSAELSSLLQCT